jgi:hypothetical protein
MDMWCARRLDRLGERGARAQPAVPGEQYAFLILPWVSVAHLASHVLSRIARRIQADWQAKYAHGLHCLETFVDTSRYRGICYRAANWQLVGESNGRSRNDRQRRLRVPRKAVYLYPLSRDCRRRLCDDT